MEIKIQYRQTGKTTDIIRELKRDETSAMIVPLRTIKDIILKNNRELKNRVFTINEVVKENVLYGREVSSIYIDEIGLCMSVLIRSPILIKYATHTNENRK